MATLTKNSYGKDRVRLTKVVRTSARHELHEYTAFLRLYGSAFEAVYVEDDNSYCVPTDTMKNAVYMIAKTKEFGSPEEFALLLTDHFVRRIDHVERCEVWIEQNVWSRILVEGKEHDHAFTKQHYRRTARCDHAKGAGEQGEMLELRGGVTGLEVLKTSGSSFSGFLKDSYTTLPETNERILATTVDAKWKFRSADAGHSFNSDAERALRVLLEVFATHQSPSLQSTLLLVGQRILDSVTTIQEIEMTMPNQHHILFDLSRFGKSNNNEIFYGTDAPSGVIQGTVSR